MAGWIVRRGSKEQGPFSTEQLKKFAASGKIKKTDLIRKDGTKKTVTADKVKGLFSGTATAAAGKRTSAKRKPPEDDYGVAEVVEGGADDFSTDGYDSYDDDYGDVDDYGDEDFGVEVIDDYGDADEFDDYDEPPRKKRRSAATDMPPRTRKSSGKKKRSSAGKSANKKKRPKDDDEDEDEDGPWMNIFYGVVCLVAGVFLFIALRDGDPDDWGNRGGLIKLILQIVYKIGGEWAVLGIMFLFAGVLFYAAYEGFQKERS